MAGTERNSSSSCLSTEIPNHAPAIFVWKRNTSTLLPHESPPTDARVAHIWLKPQNRVPHISILRCGHSREGANRFPLNNHVTTIEERTSTSLEDFLCFGNKTNLDHCV